MDNLFDYIIIIFFIVSALGSLLKKKQQKTGQQSTADRRSTLERKQPPGYSQKYGNTARYDGRKSKPLDPFETGIDLFGESKNGSRSEVDEYFEKAIRRSELERREIAPEQSKSEEFVDAEKSKKKYSDKLVSQYLETQKSKSLDERMRDIRQSIRDEDDMQIKYDGEKKSRDKALQLITKLKSTTNLRELVIFKEILDRPKAFKLWRG